MLMWPTLVYAALAMGGARAVHRMIGRKRRVGSNCPFNKTQQKLATQCKHVVTDE